MARAGLNDSAELFQPQKFWDSVTSALFPQGPQGDTASSCHPGRVKIVVSLSHPLEQQSHLPLPSQTFARVWLRIKQGAVPGRSVQSSRCRTRAWGRVWCRQGGLGWVTTSRPRWRCFGWEPLPLQMSTLMSAPPCPSRLRAVSAHLTAAQPGAGSC